MAQTLSKRFVYELSDTVERVVATEYDKDQVGSHPQGIDVSEMDRVSIFLQNKGQDTIVFRVKPGPGDVDPDTGRRIFLEAAYTGYYEYTVPSGPDVYATVLWEFYPYFIVTGQASGNGPNTAVVYVDATDDPCRRFFFWGGC